MQVKRNAFSLVELLVVIAIIGILLSLTASYLGPAQETARQLRCTNNLKSLAEGVILHELAHQRFPGFLQKHGDFAGGADPTDPANYSGAVPAHQKIGGYGVALLQYLDQQPLFEIWTDDRYPVLSNTSEATTGTDSGRGFSPLAAARIPTFQCASDVAVAGRWGTNSYVTNNGMAHFAGATPTAFAATQLNHNGVFNAKFAADPTAVGPKVTLDDLKDGLSNTAILSENAQALPWYRPGFLDGPDLTSVTYGDALLRARFINGMVWHAEDDRVGPAVDDVHKINGGGRRSLSSTRMNPSNCRDLARPSSMHLGGVNVAFADGRVRFVVDSIDYHVYQAIMTPRGKSSQVPVSEFVLTNELDE